MKTFLLSLGISALLCGVTFSETTVSKNVVPQNQLSLTISTIAQQANGGHTVIDQNKALGKQTATTANSSFHIVKDSLQVWTSNMWLDTLMSLYTYNGIVLTERLDKIWSPMFGAWGNNQKVSYTYDPTGKETDWESMKWVGTWVNSYRKYLRYANPTFPDSMTSAKGQAWNTTRNAWVDNDSATWTLNSSGQVTQYMDKYYTVSTGIWTNDTRIALSYSNGRLSTEVVSFWSTSSYSWVDYFRHSYTYDGFGRKIGDYIELYIVSPWTPFGRISYTYDAHDNLISSLSEAYSSGAWINSSQRLNTFDGNQNLIQTTAQTWSTFSGVWVNDERTFGFYSANVGVRSSNNFALAHKQTNSNLVNLFCNKNIPDYRAVTLTGRSVSTNQGMPNSGVFILSPQNNNTQSRKVSLIK